MTLIWKSLLHANFRCGRMYSARAEKQTLSYAANVRANVTPETDKRL